MVANELKDMRREHNTNKNVQVIIIDCREFKKQQQQK